MGKTYDLIMADLRRFGDRPSTRYLLLGWPRIFTSPSFKLTFWFRVGSYLKESNNPFNKILLPLVKLIHRHNQYRIGNYVDKPLSFLECLE